jgi:hypothetical protein
MSDGMEKWTWCQCCERCYLIGEFRLLNGIKLCPYKDCMGLMDIDEFPWAEIQKRHPHDYPRIPQRGMVYPN